ncbi:hypothetical protein Pcinc_004247 [Petrolisthes cinctipes]|uniref:Glucosylceramidase n=1 Tax=Petrolisthes cinctipes TaxID=88211 RepID=A0AAE1GHN0_PETCI|nr:hypothetical protein Pcinc_004247 [Petrolisthes cinctipes]
MEDVSGEANDLEGDTGWDLIGEASLEPFTVSKRLSGLGSLMGSPLLGGSCLPSLDGEELSFIKVLISFSTDPHPELFSGDTDGDDDSLILKVEAILSGDLDGECGDVGSWSSDILVRCQARSFGHDSVVCVCNATHCDLPGPSPDPTPDRYTVITSTRSGLRFHTTTPHLVDSPTPGGVMLKVATLSPQQTMTGFGSSFTDAATITTHNLSPEAQDHLIRSYFGPEGLEYDLVRVPIAGTDFSTRPYSYMDDHHHQDLDDFALSTEDIEHKLPLLRRALEISERPLRVLASPWSPPAWMKTNGKLINNGQLLPDMWHQWALYLVRFLQEYEAAGVTVWGITTQNHPFTDQVAWNSCFWTPENKRDWLKLHLGPTLKEAGLQHLRVLVGDDTRNNIDVFRIFSWFLEQAELYAINIIQTSNHHVTGWIDWNFALNTEGGPNWAESPTDAPIIIDAEKDEFYKQPMYYAMGHFSKYVPAGSVAVPSWIETDPTGGETTLIEKDIHTAAFIHPNCHLVVVILNRGEDEHVVNYLTDLGNYVSVKVSARSIQTLLVAREERQHVHPTYKYTYEAQQDSEHC